jgi:hypothetical protein
LAGFSFSAFIMETPTLDEVKNLEGRVYRVVSDVIGRDRMLNSPHRVRRADSGGLAVDFD